MRLTIRLAALAVLAALPVAHFASASFADDPKEPAAPASPAAPAPDAPTAKAEWFGDFDKAVEAAKAQNKDLLVDFTGSDWCGWCIKLHDEVFSKDAFQAASKDFVFVALDYPRSDAAKAKVPNPARNGELQQKYEIQGFPSVLLMTTDGTVIARTGYREGGPEKYLAHVVGARTTGRAILAEAPKLESGYAAAKPEEKAGLVTRAVELLEKASESGDPSGKLAAIARNAHTLDADNKAGLRLRATKAILESGAFEDADAEAAAKLDAKNEKGLRELVLSVRLGRAMQGTEDMQGFVDDVAVFAAECAPKDTETYVQILANAAGVAKQALGDETKAKSIAKILKEKGPKDNPRLNSFLDQILAEETPEPESPKEPAK